MCGIFGYLHDGPTATEPSLDVAIAAMRHRGPDDHGTFIDRTGNAVCGLANVRLAIIDLSPSGHQPMSTADGRYTITYNGEVYNHREIRRELEAAGDRFVSTSDTEAILLAYRRWGHAALAKLRGMFAFAIWDSHERRLFLARDRLGVKPLYFTRTPHVLAFASEVRTLLATGAAHRVLCARGLASYLAFGSASEPRTILRDVEMLPAGSFAYLHGGDLVIRRYWEPPLHVEAQVDRARSVERVREALDEAISLRLVADVPVSVFLSGGMDSAAVTAIASRASKRPLETFTLSMSDRRLDETAAAANTARQFGTHHHVIPISVERAASEIDEAMAAQDQPSADGINTYFVAKAVRAEGQTVALSGIGGDELFAGYPSFRRYRAVLRARALLPSAATSLLGELGRDSLPLRKTAALLAANGDPYATYNVLRAMFTEAQASSLFPHLRTIARPASDAFMQRVGAWINGASGDAVTGFSIYELTNYMRNTLLRDTDVMGMAHGLEIRDPLLDHVLVERVLALPGELKLERRRNKPLLAAAVPEIANARQRKMGFTLPFASWLKAPLRSWAEDRLAACQRVGVFDANEITGVWRGFDHDDRMWSRVWTLVSLADWCERHRVAA